MFDSINPLALAVAGAGILLLSVPAFAGTKAPDMSKYPFDPDYFRTHPNHCIYIKENYLPYVYKDIDRVAQYKSLAERWGKVYNVPPALILAIIGTESHGNPRAYRYEYHIKDASIGLMQTLCGTAKKMGFAGTCGQLYDPNTSIKYGTKFIAHLRSRYKNWLKVIASYNAGSPRYGSDGCFVNKDYVCKVLTWLYALKHKKVI